MKRAMGPIESELRARAERGRNGKPGLSPEAYLIQLGAMMSLHDQWFPFASGSVHTHGHWPDIMSEAIEAAEALGI